MGNAQGSSFQTCYVAESTWGTTPGTPAMKLLPITSNTLKLSKSTLEDNTLRGDRMRSDVRHGMKTVDGSLVGNLRYGDFDPFIAAGAFGAWESDVVKAGATESYFTVEKGFTDIEQYEPYTGLMVNKMSLSIKPDAMVPVTFEFVGKDLTMPSGTPLDASPDAYSSNAPFDSFTGTISEGGSAIGIVTGIDVTVDNGLSGSQVVGSDTINDVVAGRSKVSGTLTAYFQNLALLNKFINETESSINVVLEDVDGNTLAINIPRVKYMGGDPEVSGEGVIELSMPFEGLYDNVTGTCITFTRNAA
jgi:hypothetical protein